MDKNYEIGNFIASLRKEKGLTQGKLGQLLGVSNKAISKWENGQGLPDTSSMPKLCEILGITTDELLNGKRNVIIDGGMLDDLSRLSHVYKYYNNDSRVEIGLKDININFKIGEVVALTGISGSGKTTLLNMLGGIDHFEAGEIYFKNEGISRYDDFEYELYRKKNISYIFQDYGILEAYSIIDNLILIRLLMGDSFKEAKTKALEMLEKIGLIKYKNKKASKLSGGQKQKLSVARALLKDAPIILGDEITANLDSKSAKEVLELLFENRKNKLIVLVTHHYEEIEQYVTRKITLKGGEIIADEIIKEPTRYNQAVEGELTKKDYFIGIYTGLVHLKGNLLNFFAILISVIICVGAVFAVNVFFSKVMNGELNPYSTWYLTYTEDYVGVTKYNGDHFSYEEIENLNNLENVKAVDYNLVGIINNGYSGEKFYFRDIKQYSRDYQLEDGEALVTTSVAAVYEDTLVSLSSRYYCKFSIKEVVKNSSSNTIYLNTNCLTKLANFYSHLQENYFTYEFENEITGEFLDTDKNINTIIDFRNKVDYIKVPKSVFELLGHNVENYKIHFWAGYDSSVTFPELTYISNVKRDFIEGDDVFEISINLLDEFKSGLSKISLLTEDNKLNEVQEYTSNLGYITHSKNNVSKKLRGSNAFFSRSLFLLATLVLSFILFILIQFINRRLVGLRNKEFDILSKIGYSQKSIFICMCVPIVLASFISLAVILIINIFIPTEEWYFLLLSIIYPAILTYFGIINLKKKYYKNPREVE